MKKASTSLSPCLSLYICIRVRGKNSSSSRSTSNGRERGNMYCTKMVRYDTLQNRARSLPSSSSCIEDYKKPHTAPSATKIAADIIIHSQWRQDTKEKKGTSAPTTSQSAEQLHRLIRRLHYRWTNVSSSRKADMQAPTVTPKPSPICSRKMALRLFQVIIIPMIP